MQKTPTSRQDLLYFLIAALIMKNNITGDKIMSNSANEIGRIFVIRAKNPRGIVEIYLLKKSAKSVLRIAMT